MTVRRVLVAGGAGFVGSHLVERFLAEGDAVVCVDNLCTGTLDNLAHLAHEPRLEVIEADITMPLSIRGRIDAVLHMAAPASPLHYARLPLQTLRSGSLGTELLLSLAQHKEARFLLASTSEVYGEPAVHPQPEKYWGNVNPIGPRSMYDESKRYAEAYTVAARQELRVDAKIVRIFNTYGERMQPNDGRAVPTFVRQALAGEPLTVAGDGSQTRSLCYVDDLVEGIVRMLGSDLAGPVNLGNPQELSILRIAELVRELSRSDAPIVFVPRPVDDPSRRCPDVTVARERLGWMPRVAAQLGLARSIAWFAARTDSSRVASVPDQSSPGIHAAGVAMLRPQPSGVA